MRVSADPTFRLIGTKKNWDRGAALTSTLHGFETEMLATEENLIGLMAVNRELVAQAEAPDDSERIVLDMDSTESPVHGQQEGSAYNGHFESVCFHPFGVVSTNMGIVWRRSCVRGMCIAPRTGTSCYCPRSSANRPQGKRSPFAPTPLLPSRRSTRRWKSAESSMRFAFPANRSLECEIEEILFRPPGRPSRKPLVRYKSFRYQAGSWSKARRVVAKVEHHLGELFPRVGFIVTSMRLPSRSVVRFYNQTRHRRAMDQRGEAGDALDAAVVPSIPGQRSTAAAQRAGLQSGQPVAAFGTAEKNQELVPDQFAAPPAEKRAVGWSSTLDTTGWCWPRGI